MPVKSVSLLSLWIISEPPTAFQLTYPILLFQILFAINEINQNFNPFIVITTTCGYITKGSYLLCDKLFINIAQFYVSIVICLFFFTKTYSFTKPLYFLNNHFEVGTKIATAKEFTQLLYFQMLVRLKI